MRIVASAALLLAAVAATGCSTLVKQGYYTVTGAKGSFYEVQIVDPAELATYESVRVVPFENELGAAVPASVLREVNNNVPASVAEEKLFYPEGKRLRVEGRVIHYTGESGLIGAASAIIGGAGSCVCRVQLLDDASGSLVGEGVCWGTVKSAIRRGSDEYGEGVGKGVAKWIAKRLPEDEVEERRAALEDSE